jgi:hypothetical protein
MPKDHAWDTGREWAKKLCFIEFIGRVVKTASAVMIVRLL